MNTKLSFSISVILISIFISTIVFAQGKISGMVYDSKDGSALKDVTVKVLKLKDSSLVKGTATDEKGGFVIEGIGYGKYNLVFSYIGYKNLYKKINLSETNTVINLDSVKLSTEGYSTEQINVESDIPDMKFEDEKKIFNVEKLTSTKGGTALDVLKKVPMIDVDMNDNVTLRGSANVLILIDDKPMKFASLRQIPADAIKNVEIITNPSAKYESEGVTGIINLVMQDKKPDVVGYNGYTYTGIRSDVKGGYLGAGINVKMGKWSYFINGGGGRFDRKNNSFTNTYYDNPVSSFESYSDGTGISKFGYGSIGAEYEITKGHSIGTDININPYTYTNLNTGKSRSYNLLGYLTSLYDNNSDGDGEYSNYGVSLYYNGKFKKPGRELNIDLYLGKDINDYSNNQLQQYYDSLLSPIPGPNKQKSSTNNKNTNVKLQADFTNPFSDQTKLETGYKGIFRDNDNDYIYDTLNYSYGGYIRNTGLTNHFKLNESINAVYGTLSHKIKDFKFKIGLRLEHTHTYGELITNGDNFTKDYTNLFPTVSVSQKIGTMNEFQLSYSRRITRPNIWRLNPFVNRYNNRYIYYGNPELQPEFTNSFELSHNFFTNFITVTTSLFYRKSYDVMSNYSYIIDTTTTVTTYRNGAGAQSYGSDFIVRTSALKWLTVNATFSMYQSKFEGSVLNDYKGEEGFSWRANIRSTVKVGEFLNIELFYNYNGKRFNATGFNEPMQNFDIGINKEFFKKKLTIGLRAEDVFNTRKWGSENNGIGFRSVSSSTWDSRLLFINISYNFGNTDEYYQKSKKTKQNENENQDEKEGNK
jgi:outer membrane receptor protein involved in Fe transport